MIIDANNTILGRLASYSAKKALSGEEVIIINAEKAIISGNKENILKRYKFKRDIGNTQGPFFPRMPDRIVRRTIRGMLPRKTSHGREAFSKIQVHIGEPKEITGEKTQIPHTKAQLKNDKYTTISEISKWLGKK